MTSPDEGVVNIPGVSPWDPKQIGEFSVCGFILIQLTEEKKQNKNTDYINVD